MASRESNIEPNQWVVNLLELKDTDHVLEVDFGPGLAVGIVVNQLIRGTVTAIDHSKVMFDQASRRNKANIARGKIKRVLGSADSIGNTATVDSAEKFEGIFSSNVAPFREHLWTSIAHCAHGYQRTASLPRN